MSVIFRTLASLRLTVACLAVSVLLIFIGTVAQADEGLYQAQARYFKQWLVWGPVLFGARLPILLPGGYLLGTVLVINLATAHIRRFEWSARKWGVHLTHLGIVVLLAGQLASDMLSRETHLRLREGEARNYTEKHRAHELVFVPRSGIQDEEIIALPEAVIAGSTSIGHPELPFGLRVKNYQANSDILSREAVLEAATEINAALAAVEARFGTTEGLQEQAGEAARNRARRDVWRAALAAIGAEEREDLPIAVSALDSIQQDRLREELKRRFREEMLGAFLRQGGAAGVAAERVRHGEATTAETLPVEADRGHGREAFARPLPESRELDAVNVPYAVVELVQGEESLGTWLFSPWLGPQEIRLGETVWHAEFRPVRIYHPFTVQLLRTTHEVYRGTDIPKNFQSRIRIEHPARGERREVDISMNSPLRYEGLTFYQYQMGRDEAAANVRTSVLLAVRNPAWIGPYVGCILVAGGMSYHFLLHLVGFIGRRRRPDAAALPRSPGEGEVARRQGAPARRWRSFFARAEAPPYGFGRRKFVPLLIAGLAVLWVLSALRPADGDVPEQAIDHFGRLPIVANGRIQPMDSLARNSLLQLREKQTVSPEPWKNRRERPRSLPASEWLMAMMMNPESANVWPVFRIDHPDLKGLLGLPNEPHAGRRTDGKHFVWPEILSGLQDLQREARRAGEVEASRQTSYEQAVVRLWGNVALYMRLQNTLQPQNAKDWERELADFAAHAPAGIAAMVARQEGRPHDSAAMDRVLMDLQRMEVMSQLDLPLIVPPDDDGDWMSTVDALVEVARGEEMPVALEAYARMATAWRAGDPAAFHEAEAQWRRILEARFPSEVRKAEREHLFNRLAPFQKALVLYGAAFLFILGFWIRPNRLDWMRRSAIGLVLVALTVHTVGLVFRMSLEGRPPVTNLYSSAVFVGWGACVLGLILERFWRNSMGVVAASIVGLLTLIIAHHLSLGGDTMEMMRAVLDTNFWLATHVTVITLGYASTFVAGFLGALYVLRGVLSRSLDPAAGTSLARMAYGILCFATLFSFVGTLLGGIWADQSWGRFWGWDPKENGALIIVLWNALVLHARWGRLVGDRGLMNLAIVGNIATAWSWFGVNMLGIGLHSYGFMDAGFRWLLLFAGSQLLIVALGSFPTKYWRSGPRQNAETLKS